jgi:hypothetical protein
MAWSSDELAVVEAPLAAFFVLAFLAVPALVSCPAGDADALAVIIRDSANAIARFISPPAELMDIHFYSCAPKQQI